MPEKMILVHPRDPADDTILAIIYPTGRIGGTDDPALVARLRAALNAPGATGYDPVFSGSLRGPAANYPGDSLEWATVVQCRLLDLGLTGETVGYAWPPLDEFPPDATPSDRLSSSQDRCQ